MDTTALQKPAPTILPSIFAGDENVSQRTQSSAGSIGERIARLRKEKGITQIEMAERLGVSQPVVSDYERGAIRLHGELILELAKIFGTSTDEILGVNEVAKTSPGVRNRRLLRRVQAIDQLPRRDQEALLRTIDAFLDRAG